MIVKAKILKVGQAYRDENGSPVLTGWAFDAAGESFPHDANKVLGYTFEELQEIAARNQ